MLVLREDDVRAILTMPETIPFWRPRFAVQGEDATRNQPRRRVVLPDGRGVLHTMSAFVPGEPGRPEADGPGLLGLKTYSTFKEGVRFAVLLYSAADGAPLALIEADWLGQMRTGAASGLASKYLAREDVKILGRDWDRLAGAHTGRRGHGGSRIRPHPDLWARRVPPQRLRGRDDA